jgi:hypothetical protein
MAYSHSKNGVASPDHMPACSLCGPGAPLIETAGTSPAMTINKRPWPKFSA